MTTAPVAPPTARRTPLGYDALMRLAATEYDRVIAVLRALPDDAWGRPSGNPGWDVRDLAAHLLGMAELAASMREQVRQLRLAKRAGGELVDGLTALQVRERAAMTPAQIIERFAEVAPRAVAGRRRLPGFLRGRAMPGPQPVGGKPDSPHERWTLGYFVGVILTRDPWMHRTELSAAGGVPLELTADHDGVIVADIAQEWAGRHGQPCTLVLTGPAGGSWTWGTGGPTHELDAVEFCRLLSGRGEADGLLRTEVPF